MPREEFGDAFVARDVTFAAEHAPVHGQRRQAERATVMGERVEEGIGRAVIPLRRIPKDAGDGREHYEAIEREILCALVQQPCAIRLWRHHGPQALAVERGERRVVDDHREVKYAAERLIARADFREQAGNIFG